MRLDELGPFDSVLDVGGNLGEFAEQCRRLWPTAQITSFEPIPAIARENKRRAGGRWWTEQVAISDKPGDVELRVCLNQHSASTLQPSGTVRHELFGIVDRFETVTVEAHRLDEYHRYANGRSLVKIDVEGHEGEVILGARSVLSNASVVIVECNQADVFVGAPTPHGVDVMLRLAGLRFAGVLGVQLAPSGEVVQVDGVWTDSPLS